MKRTAFTLVELLIIIGLLLLLTALVLPAIQRVRLISNKLEIAVKLKTITQAAHSYAAAHGGKLPGITNFKTNFQPGDKLPFIEYAAYLDQPLPPFSLPPLYPRIRAYESPLDYSLADLTSGIILYPGIGYSSFALNALCHIGSPRMSNVATDGLAQTIYVGEHYMLTGSTGSCFNTYSSRPLDWQTNAHELLTMGSRPGFFANEGSLDVVPIVSSSPINTVPSVPGVTFQDRPEMQLANPGLLQSTMPMGLMVGMFDGSVRCINPHVSVTVFWGAITPNGKESINVNLLGEN